MPIRNQKIPPLKRIHAECKRFKSFPRIVQEYAEDAHPIKIIPIIIINPSNNSTHLFMSKGGNFSLKRFLLCKNYVRKSLKACFGGILYEGNQKK